MKTYMITIIQNNNVMEVMQSSDLSNFLVGEPKIMIYNLV